MTNSSLIAVVGPTGSGKSALAVFLAEALGGEVVNFDSVQLYRDLDIGSAKTSLSERRGVPHHLLDVLSPEEDFNAGAFARLAKECLREIGGRKRVAILTGGTGFYLRSLLEGLPAAPERNSPLRARLSKLAGKRPAALHRFLRRADPAAARRIHHNDHQKLIRAIELACSASRATPERMPEALPVLKLGLNPTRADLYRRLNLRCEAMFAQGLLEEVGRLLNSGVRPGSRALQSLGYKQAVQVLNQQLSLADAITETQIRTRQYAKRQMTWFRRESGVQWLAGFGSDPAIQQAALEYVQTAGL